MLSRARGRGIGREWTGGVKLEIRMSKFATHFSRTVRAEPPSSVGGQVAAADGCLTAICRLPIYHGWRAGRQRV